MKKVHSDGLLESLDFKSFDRYEPYLIGKMTKTLFSSVMERPPDFADTSHALWENWGETSRHPYRLLWGRRGVTSIVLVYSEFGGGDCTEANTNMFYFFASGQQAVKPADILPKSFWTR
jgi:hypothetical protein